MVDDFAAITPEQFETILNELKSGTPRDIAIRRARVSEDSFRALLNSSDDLTEYIEDAEAAGGSRQKQARTYDDDPPPNDGDEPPKPKAKGRKKKGEEEEEKPEVDFAKIADMAREFAPGLTGYLMWVNHKLEGIGMHKMSPWWMFTLRSFLESEQRWLIVRAGRGSGKSTTLSRVAATGAIFTDRLVPPGQRWVYPFISVSTDDAARRIVEIAAVVQAVGIDYKLSRSSGRQSIEMQDAHGGDIAFISLASTIAGVSGPNAIGAIVDEEAKLRDKRTNANPATEILASLLQTFRAREGIRAIRCSSAMNNDGSHAQAVAEGSNDVNYVARIGQTFLPELVDGLLDVAIYEEQSEKNKAGADKIRAYASTLTADSPNVPTWVANPSISAMACRKEVNALPSAALEGTTRVDYWLRENASLPLSGKATVSAEAISQYADFNQRLVARKNPSGLISFNHLPSYDPRSSRYGRGNSRGPTF